MTSTTQSRRHFLSILFMAMPAFVLAQPPAGNHYYQDFRKKAELIDELKYFGADMDEISKKEDAGLRVTLTAKREWKGAVGIQTTIPLTGDFEITAGYEILAIERPQLGSPGVGVALNLANEPDLQNFAKLGRFHLFKYGNVHLAEAWHRDLPKDNPLRVWKQGPTEAKSGRIRLKRESEIMRFLYADGQDPEFRELDSREFNERDIKLVRLLVTNNASPALIDARLVDLRIRTGMGPNQANAPVAPPKIPAPAQDDGHAAADNPGWLTVIMLAGGAGIVVCFALVVVLLLLRSRRAKPEAVKETVPSDAAVTLSFACSECGKKLKAKLDSAGKKIKCPQCGKAMLVPVEVNANQA